MGMNPPLTKTGTRFAAIPTKARLKPGSRRLAQQPSSRRPNAVANSGSRSASAAGTPALSAISVPKRTIAPRMRAASQRSRRVFSTRLAKEPPARKPATRPSAIPPISTR
jgi:hypothetical protein